MRKLIVGNWKMNGNLSANAALVQGVLASVGQPTLRINALTVGGTA